MIEKLALDALRIDERAEVDAAMRNGAFLADNHDVVVWWLVCLFAGCGGVGAYLGGGIGYYERYAALIAGLVVIAWTTWVWVSTWNRRGCLSTSFGTYVMRGKTLKGVRHAHVAKILRRQLRTRRMSFTVFELITTDGKKLTMYAHADWATHAIAAIEKVKGPVPQAEY